MRAALRQVQLGSHVAVVREGRLAVVVNAHAVAPQLLAARPRALLASPADAAGAAGAAEAEAGPEAPPSPSSGGFKDELLGEGVVTLWGYGISNWNDMVVCRQAGKFSRGGCQKCRARA